MRTRLLLGALLSLLGAGPAAAAPDAPVLVALVLDTSGSLSKADHARRTTLAAELVDALPPGSAVAVYAFDDQPRLVLPATDDAQAVRAAVSRLQKSGRFTALYDALYDASSDLTRQTVGAKAIVLVSDGLDENSAADLEDGLKVAREDRIPVFTIGVGRVQDKVLRRIAKLTSGSYVPGREKAGPLAARIVERAQSLSAERRSRAAAPSAGPAAPAAPAPATSGASRPAAGAAAGARVEESGGSRTLPWVVPLLLLVGVGLVVALYVGRRQPALARVGAAPGASAASPPPDDDDDGGSTLVTRFDEVEGASPTMVLTLKPLLHVTKGPAAGRFFEVNLDAATSIGRAKGNEVVLDDRAVSNQHCRIRPAADGSFELLDLKSTNGTFVNQRRVSRHVLSAGDLIKCGESTLQFRMDHMKTAP